jgi:hypothetical protein
MTAVMASEINDVQNEIGDFEERLTKYAKRERLTDEERDSVQTALDAFERAQRALDVAYNA